MQNFPPLCIVYYDILEKKEEKRTNNFANSCNYITTAYTESLNKTKKIKSALKTNTGTKVNKHFTFDSCKYANRINYFKICAYVRSALNFETRQKYHDNRDERFFQFTYILFRCFPHKRNHRRDDDKLKRLST